MSTLSIYDKVNLPTDIVLNSYFRSVGLDVLKKARFDFGKPINHRKLKEMLLLNRFACNAPCYVGQADIESMREKIIKNSILRIDEL